MNYFNYVTLFRRCFIVFLATFCIGLSSQTSANDTGKYPEFELGGLQLGDKWEKALELFDKPNGVKNWYANFDYKTYYYSGVQIIVAVIDGGNMDVVCDISTTVPGIKTRRGIGVGDNLTTLINTYPDLISRKEDDNKSYRVYVYPPKRGIRFLLFEVDKETQVVTKIMSFIEE